jgi:hypothetical protein
MADGPGAALDDEPPGVSEVQLCDRATTATNPALLTAAKLRRRTIVMS